MIGKSQLWNQWIGRKVTSGAAVDQTVFVHDRGQISLQFDKSGSGTLSTSDLSHRYLWGPAVDQLLADEHVESLTSSAANETLWALTDGLGTVHDMADDSGTYRLHRVFDSFGNIVDEEHFDASGSAVTSPSQAGYVDTIFAFTGRPLDDATGLQNNLHRWYDAETGRWISEDPIGFAAGDANLSRYVGNATTGYVDPNGLQGHPGQKGRRGVGGKPRSNPGSGYWSGVGEVFQGYGDAAYGVGEGIYGLLTTDPRQTVRGMADAVYNYDETAEAIYDEYKEKGGTLRGQGELVGDVLIGVATGGVLKSAKTANKFRKCAPNRTVIGKWAPKSNDISGLRPGENSLQKHLPNQGSPRANWKQNSSVLRQEIRKGNPIRDAGVNPDGTLIDYPGSFLNAERNLIRNQGWTFDPSTGLWSPGK